MVTDVSSQMVTDVSLKLDLSPWGYGVRDCGMPLSSLEANATVLDMINECTCNSLLMQFAIKYISGFGNVLSQIRFYRDTTPVCHPSQPYNTSEATWQLYKNNVRDPNQAINLNKVNSSDNLLFKYEKN